MLFALFPFLFFNRCKNLFSFIRSLSFGSVHPSLLRKTHMIREKCVFIVVDVLECIFSVRFFYLFKLSHSICVCKQYFMNRPKINTHQRSIERRHAMSTAHSSTTLQLLSANVFWCSSSIIILIPCTYMRNNHE